MWAAQASHSDALNQSVMYNNISRAPDQNGVSQAWSIGEIHHSGWESSIYIWTVSFLLLILFFHSCQNCACRPSPVPYIKKKTQKQRQKKIYTHTHTHTRTHTHTHVHTYTIFPLLSELCLFTFTNPIVWLIVGTSLEILQLTFSTPCSS